MGTGARLSLFLLLLSFALLAGGAAEDVAVESEAPDSSLQLELEKLRSKILVLESNILDKNRELRNKDDSISHMGKIIQERSEGINLAQREIESIKKRGSLNDVELVEKAQARIMELERQVVELKDEIKTQTQNKNALEARANAAQKTINELKSKLEHLQRTNDEQRRQLQKTQHTLKVVEEELLKAKSEVSSKKKEIAEICAAWLPPWVASHLDYCQNFSASLWNKHGKPAFVAFSRKALEISGQAQKHIEPHWDLLKSKWLPALMEQWTSFSNFVQPHVKLASAKTIGFYKTSLSCLKPHAIRAQKVAHPYFKEGGKIVKPYVDQVVTLTKPHIEKVHAALVPYTNKVAHSYKDFLKLASSYHQEVQYVVREKLKKHEITKSLATNGLVWIMASASLALPFYLSYRLLRSIFWKKAPKSSSGSQGSQAHRKHKRRHS